MLSLLKSPKSTLAIVLLALTSARTVIASPFGPLDGATSLSGRAHGSKFVGSKCISNSECYSSNCKDNVCRRQPSGGRCFENNNCASRKCTKGRCASSPTHTTSTTSAPSSTSTSPPLLQLGQKCSNYLQCASHGCEVDPVGTSQEKVCVLLSAQGSCDVNEQCFSGRCISLCDLDGNQEGCEFNDVCDPQPIGASCRTSEDCVGGNVACVNQKCNDGKTASSTSTKPSTSTKSSTSTKKSTTSTPSPTSLGAGEPWSFCDTNEQCYSGRCVSLCTLDGNQEGCEFNTVCDTQSIGGSCRTRNDCETNFCVNGKCTTSA